MAGRIHHWKHGWVPLDDYARAVKAGHTVETVRALVANHKAINAELTSQGVSADHPMRGVLTRQRGNHFVVARDHGRIVGGVAFNKESYGDVGITEVRVMGDAQKSGIGHRMIAEVARSVGPRGTMTVYGAVDSAKPFYAKTGATFNPDSSLGTWSPAAVNAMKRGLRPPPGEVITRQEAWVRELRRVQTEYPDWYRELHGTASPEAVAKQTDLGVEPPSSVIAR